MHIATLTVTGALASLKSSLEGLSAKEASRRREEFGPNRVEAVPGTPLAVRFLREFTHLFALVLWVAAALAFGAESAQPGQGMLQLGYAIVCVITGINEDGTWPRSGPSIQPIRPSERARAWRACLF